MSCFQRMKNIKFWLIIQCLLTDVKIVIIQLRRTIIKFLKTPQCVVYVIPKLVLILKLCQNKGSKMSLIQLFHVVQCIKKNLRFSCGPYEGWICKRPKLKNPRKQLRERKRKHDESEKSLKKKRKISPNKELYILKFKTKFISFL